MDFPAIQKIAVVGCGTMGRGILQTIAGHGFNVLFLERTDEAVDAARAALERSLAHQMERWALTDAERRAILARTEGTADPKRLAECDLAFEVVDEVPEIKHRVIREIDRHLKPNGPILSNTSALSITELASHTRRPELVAGAHFLFPATRRPVVEVIRGLKTSDDTVEFTLRLLRAFGKHGVEVFEYPGYITTRLIVPYLNEAMFIVMEGIATAQDVDKAARLGYDFPTGPLTMADRFGLDEVLNWMEQLFHELGEVKYRPCPLLRKLVRAGRLGVKTRHGFFEYDEDGKRVGTPASF